MCSFEPVIRRAACSARLAVRSPSTATNWCSTCCSRTMPSSPVAHRYDGNGSYFHDPAGRLGSQQRRECLHGFRVVAGRVQAAADSGRRIDHGLHRGVHRHARRRRPGAGDQAARRRHDGPRRDAQDLRAAGRVLRPLPGGVEQPHGVRHYRRRARPLASEGLQRRHADARVVGRQHPGGSRRRPLGGPRRQHRRRSDLGEHGHAGRVCVRCAGRSCARSMP